MGRRAYERTAYLDKQAKALESTRQALGLSMREVRELLRVDYQMMRAFAAGRSILPDVLLYNVRELGTLEWQFVDLYIRKLWDMTDGQ